MAQFSTNFSEYTPGSPPGDWTARWVTTNVTNNVVANAIGDGGNILRSTSTADARRMLSWDDIDADANRDNVEILARFRLSDTGLSSTDGLRLHVRSSGAAGAETSYFLRLPTAANSSWALNKYVAGVSTAIGSAVVFPLVANTLYNARFRVNGTTLRARVWADGTPEPSSWEVDTTDSSIASAGWVGVGRVESTPTTDFTHFIAATNGDTATWPAAVDTLARVTQVAPEVVSATDPSLIATQIAIEVASSNSLNMIVTQVALEVCSTNVPDDLGNVNKYRQIQIAC